jgi:hypothetical protein
MFLLVLAQSQAIVIITYIHILGPQTCSKIDPIFM